MCDFSYDKGKETNFYIFYRGRWEIYFNFLSIFNSTDVLFDLKIADMIAYGVIALLRYLNVVTPQLAKSDNVIS